MADLIYSTGYGDEAESFIWTPHRGLAGFFQVKEDQSSAEPYGSAVFSSPNLGYRSGVEYYWDGVIDYETARHWPHP